MLLVFISFVTKTKQMTLVFERLKTKLMKTNILFGFITETKLMVLVFDVLKTKQIKTMLSKGSKNFLGGGGMAFCFLGLRIKLIKTNVVSFYLFYY